MAFFIKNNVLNIIFADMREFSAFFVKSIAMNIIFVDFRRKMGGFHKNQCYAQAGNNLRNNAVFSAKICT
jgi:hypothetical protein